jgi:hypothetical protein
METPVYPTCIVYLQDASKGMVMKDTMESEMVKWNTRKCTLVLVLGYRGLHLKQTSEKL